MRAQATESTGEEIVINYPTFQCGVNTASPVVDQLIEEFNAEYAGKYRIQKEDVPGDANYVDKINKIAANGHAPRLYTAAVTTCSTWPWRRTSLLT